VLKKLSAIGLLTLALSPFTAPFQTWDADDAKASQMAPLELFSAFRNDSDLCALVPVRDIDSDYVTIALLSGLTSLTSFVASCATACFTRSAVLTSNAAEYSIRTAILRL
jgi:hypothetical protein